MRYSSDYKNKNRNYESGKAIQIYPDFEKICQHALSLLKNRGSRKILFLISCNTLVIYHLWKWSLLTNSISLKAFTNTVLFNVCSLAVCMVSIWVEQNTLKSNSKFVSSRHDGDKFLLETTRSNYKQQLQSKVHRSCSADDTVVIDLGKVSSPNDSDPVSISVLGLEKYEVLALFVTSCFSLIVSLFTVVQAISRIREQPNVTQEGWLGLGATLGLVSHLLTIFAHPDASLNHVVCKALPCPTLKGINPILGGNFISFFILCGVHAVLHFWKLNNVDTGAVFAIIGLSAASMVPLAFFTASTVLQKLSHHMSMQLDKCLRDALIIDGVLEFKNEKFWTQSFGKLAGSLEVRIRKGADESYVLSKVIKKLSQVVSTLNVQEFRVPMNRSIMEFSLEYYVDELLESEKMKMKKLFKKPEETGSMKENIKIEDILNCTSSLLDFEKKKSYSMLLFENNQLRSGKSILLRNNSVKNALLLSGQCDLKDSQGPSRLLCTQS